MITVGAREVIFHETILLPVGEDTWIEASHNGEAVKLHVFFEDPASEGEKSAERDKAYVSVEGKEDHASVKLVNWHSPFGSGTLPMQVGAMDDGRPILLMVECARRDKTARLIVQIMLGASK